MRADTIQVLFVDDQVEFFRGGRFESVLAKEGISLTYESHSSKAMEWLAGHSEFDLLLLDLIFENDTVQGEDVLLETRREFPALPVVIFTSVDSASRALRLVRDLGAFDYIPKAEEGIDLDRLVQSIRHAVEHARLQKKYLLLKEFYAQPVEGDLIGKSAAITAVKEQIARAAGVDRTTVLITGETGTGKELAAASIHSQSVRKNEPLVKVNCAAIPADLLESQLFGHEKGAFTGAVTASPGLFRTADGGVLFLDEVAELDQSLQSKLLRVLQDGEFYAVGARRPNRVDVRVIAATNRDLLKEVREGRFREDVYYRLNVFPIQMPALRERLEDLPLLIEALLRKHSRLMGRPVLGISREALAVLERYRWPGNVRELENALQRAMILADPARNELEASDFRYLGNNAGPTSPGGPAYLDRNVEDLFSGSVSLEEILDRLKSHNLRQILVEVMSKFAGKRNRLPTQAELAEILRMSRTSLANFLARSELPYRQLKTEAERRPHTSSA
jgi:DNA-binding NtrC family response regulator